MNYSFYLTVLLMVFKSIQTDCVFTSAMKFHSSDIVNSKNIKTYIAEDVDVIAKTLLKNEIAILPYPKNLNEVMKMREKKEIITFREVMSNWIETLHKGEQYLEPKLRKDIAKANKELKKLENWREYQFSPINFWINSIGGHIPILSNILTGIYTLTGVYEHISNKKYNWVMLLK